MSGEAVKCAHLFYKTSPVQATSVYTLPQKKRKFNVPIFPGAPGFLILIQVHVAFVKYSLRVTCKRRQSKIPNGSLTVLKCLSTSLLCKITKQLKSHCS